MMNCHNYCLCVVVFFSLFCSHFEVSASDESLDQKLKALVKHKLGLTGYPVAESSLPNIGTSPLAQLGRELFFSKSLSMGFDMSCAGCHHPFLAGGDGLSLPVGVGALDEDLIGPGRRHDGNDQIDPEANGGPNVERNSPTTFNSVFYKHVLFHDGRIERLIQHDGKYIRTSELKAAQPLLSQETEQKALQERSFFITPNSIFRGVDIHSENTLLQVQARFPVVAPAEMKGFSGKIQSDNEVRSYLAKRLRGETGELKINQWEQHFRKGFNEYGTPIKELITFSRITEALAEYQRSQVFIDNPWKAYLENKGSLSQKAKQGAVLFFSDVNNGGADCVSCHSGDFFTNEKYNNLAVPQFGRGNFVYGQDLGRHSVTRSLSGAAHQQKEKEIYAFRVPPLLNVSETGPYGHTGAFIDLDSMVRHHLDPVKSIQTYDFTLQHLPQFKGLGVEYPEAKANTNVALQQLTKTNSDRKKITLEDSQIAAVVEFLKTLTDPCITSMECLAPWMPEGDPPDIHRLIAKIPKRFDNAAKLPEAKEKEKIKMSPLMTDLKDVPLFDPQCQIAPGKSKHGSTFVLVTEKSGISTNRQFNFDAVRTGDVINLPRLFSGGVAAGDINGDCHHDLIIDQGNMAAAHIYINNGNGTFRLASDDWGLDKKKTFSEAMLADFNGDGWLDIFHSNSDRGSPDIYLNNGQSRFIWVEKSGFKVIRPARGVGFGDVDGDGDLDVFLAHWAQSLQAEEEHLWLNNGKGFFIPGAKKFGLTSHFSERDFTFTPNFSDLNGDNKADLLSVADYFTSQVFLNKNNNLFVNITDKKVITDEFGMGTAIADFDNDGDMDWFVSSIFNPKYVREKEDDGPDEGVLDGDGFDVFESGAFAASGNRLYRNDSNLKEQPFFTDITDAAGVRDGGWGWGACAADFNNDGWLDIFHTNGVPMAPSNVRKDLHYLFPLLDMEAFPDVRSYDSVNSFVEMYRDRLNDKQFEDLKTLYYVGQENGAVFDFVDDIDPKARLFINDKKGGFVEQADHFGIADSGQGRGISCLDYDRDGDIDVLIINNQGKPALYRNDFGSKNNFLTVKLIGKAPNVHAIGAKLYLEMDSGRQVREVRVENNYMSQNPIESHFGLGNNEVVNKLTVVWADGSKYEESSIQARKILVVKQ